MGVILALSRGHLPGPIDLNAQPKGIAQLLGVQRQDAPQAHIKGAAHHRHAQVRLSPEGVTPQGFIVEPKRDVEGQPCGQTNLMITTINITR